MKRIKIKNAGAKLFAWIIVSAVLSGIAAIWSVENGISRDHKIFLLYFMLLMLPVYYILFPSIAKEEELLIKRKNKFLKKTKDINKQKCDARKIDHPEGGFTCSILGDTIGANWLWEISPYKEEFIDSPECTATFSRKKGLFGEKCFFSCWVMGEFRVKNNLKELEQKVKIKMKS